MFAGKLPKLPIELSDAKTFLGICVCKKRKLDNGKVEKYDFKLRINTRIDLPEKEVEDTIIHEMIHYFIGFNQLEDTSSHGALFLHMMNTINEKYGRNLTVSHKGTKEQIEQAVDTKAHWHVIAAVYFTDGRFGVKVLPRVVPKIVTYYNKMTEQKEIQCIELYMSNNPFFNKYPNSGALNAHLAYREEIFRQLGDAEKMGCDGKSIIRRK